MHRDLNDYEIIYLITEGDDDAFEFMVAKYHPLIAKTIRKFHLAYMYDDMYQESLMLLHKSIFAYDPSYKKTFTKFFELNLTRMFITAIDKLKRNYNAQQLHEDRLKYAFHSETLKGPYFDIYLADIKGALTENEYNVFYLREVTHAHIQLIVDQLKMPEKQIYNALHRAKRKIKTLYHHDNLDKA